MSNSKVRVTVLVEDTAGARGTLGEHGLSIRIETASHRVLFDTGVAQDGVRFVHGRLGVGQAIEKNRTGQ